ncbi:unnamed protein product [Lupinus luteus]|uniref:Pollen Ole e 1 allergen and extensin family protein n=1 Tax=Lupinus luteus TaxID=3873 RepID=A0AAV1Y9T9_LUPLU
MAKSPTLFLLLVCFSFGVFSLELDTTLPPSSFLSTHAHPPHHCHHHNHHSHVRAKPPTHTTAHAHAKPPAHHIHNPSPPSPYPPHIYPMVNTYAAFEGIVYKKVCKHAGTDNLSEATPLPGATVMVKCVTSSRTILQSVKTASSGAFHMESGSIKPEFVELGQCKMFLASSPNGLKISNYNDGLRGSSVFRPVRLIQNGKFFLFGVGPFAVEPNCP